MKLQFHEQIYTSAPKLLLEQRGDLGIVAQDHRFPKDVQPELKQVRSYQRLKELPVDVPAQHPAQFIIRLRGKNGQYLALSRVVFAGADHTARTAPLVHHILFLRDDLEHKKIALSNLLPALSREFRSQWESDPQYLETKSIDGIEKRASFRTASWGGIDKSSFAQFMGVFVTQYMQTQISGRQIVIALSIKESREITKNIADLLDLLPVPYQFLSIHSHVTDQSQLQPDTQIIFTYPDSDFLMQAKQRKDERAPLVIDITNLDIEHETVEGYGLEIKTLLEKDASYQPEVVEVMRNTVLDLGLEAVNKPQLSEAAFKFSKEVANKNYDSHKLRELTDQLSGDPALKEFLQTRMKRLLETLVDEKNWRLLIEVWGEWQSSNGTAKNLLEKNASDAIQGTLKQATLTDAEWKFLQNVFFNTKLLDKFKELISERIKKTPPTETQKFFETVKPLANPDSINDWFRALKCHEPADNWGQAQMSFLRWAFEQAEKTELPNLDFEILKSMFMHFKRYQPDLATAMIKKSVADEASLKDILDWLKHESTIANFSCELTTGFNNPEINSRLVEAGFILPKTILPNHRDKSFGLPIPNQLKEQHAKPNSSTRNSGFQRKGKRVPRTPDIKDLSQVNKISRYILLFVCAAIFLTSCILLPLEILNREHYPQFVHPYLNFKRPWSIFLAAFIGLSIAGFAFEIWANQVRHVNKQNKLFLSRLIVISTLTAGFFVVLIGTYLI